MKDCLVLPTNGKSFFFFLVFIYFIFKIWFNFLFKGVWINMVSEWIHFWLIKMKAQLFAAPDVIRVHFQIFTVWGLPKMLGVLVVSDWYCWHFSKIRSHWLSRAGGMWRVCITIARSSVFLTGKACAALSHLLRSGKNSRASGTHWCEM